MPITLDCALCNKKFRVPDNAVGKRLACPHCKWPVHAPGAEDDSRDEVPEIDDIQVLADEAQPRAAVEAETAVQTQALDRPQEQTPEVVDVEALDDEDDKSPYTVQEDSGVALDVSVAGALAQLRLRSDLVGCVAYGPDHTTALASGERGFCFLDLKTRRCVSARRMHSAPITCLVISADGKLALSGDAEGGLLLWDMPHRKALRWLEGHRDEVRTAAFSADGGYAASGGRGGAVRLWRLPTGEKISLEGGRLNEYVNCLSFSPDGRLLVVIGDQGHARLWRVPSGESAGKLPKGCENLHSAAFSKDGACILATGKRFRVCKWHVESGEKRSCFAGYDERLPRVLRTWITPDGHGLLVWSYAPEFDGRCRDDAPGGMVVQNSFLVGAPAILAAPVGGLVIACASGIIGTAAWAATKTAENVVDAAAIPAGSKHSLAFWDVSYENPVRSVVLDDAPQALACSSDGHRVLVGFEEGIVRLYAL